MRITRREFLALAGVTAASIGVGLSDRRALEEALAAPGAPVVLWLQGAACTGCSVSFLNRVSGTAPETAADILIETVDLRYHPNIMAAAGDLAVSVARDAYQQGGYLLAVEGGVPTAFGGCACWAWSHAGREVTFKDAVTDLASRASAVLAVGTCASFGGIPAAPPNPAGVRGVAAATGVKTVNLAGCPTHPDTIVWTLAQILSGRTVSLDSFGRPRRFFGGESIHEECPYEDREEADVLGQAGLCLKDLGCRGPRTQGSCPDQLFNGGRNWCMGAGAPCIGCHNPDFPGTAPLYSAVDQDD